MTLRILLTIDEGEGSELIALLAKALGRGELGILEFKIEAHERPPLLLAPARKLGRPTKVVEPVKVPKKKGHTAGVPMPNSPGLGGHRLVLVRAFAEKNGGAFTHADAQRAFKSGGFSETGFASAAKHWIKWGLVEQTGKGAYRVTPSKPPDS